MTQVFRFSARSASRDLMTEPHVTTGLSGQIAYYLAKNEKLASLLKAAGIPEPNPPTDTPAK